MALQPPLIFVQGPAWPGDECNADGTLKLSMYVDNVKPLLFLPGDANK